MYLVVNDYSNGKCIITSIAELPIKIHEICEEWVIEHYGNEIEWMIANKIVVK